MTHTSGENRTIRLIEVTELTVEETFVVALGEQPDGTGRILMFQLALTFDEQDRDLGMDTYCLVNEEGAAHYGGVTSCILTQEELTLQLTPEAASTMALASPCRLQLQVDPSAIEQLRGGLQRVLTIGSDPPPELHL